MTPKCDVHVKVQTLWCNRLPRRIATCAVVAIAVIAASAGIAARAEAQLGVSGSQIFQQGEGGVPGSPAALESFGRALAVGDFDGDGFVDLALGAPRESIAPVAEAGSVTVLYGGAAGLAGAGSEVWDLNGPAGQVASTGDRLGSALAAADFDHDGFADLAIGVPYRDIVTPEATVELRAGAVLVLYGSAAGLVEAGAQYLRQGAGGIVGALEEDDFFGESLSTGDFDGDGFADLAIGVPGEDVGAIGNAGAVNVVYGSSAGLSTAPGTTADISLDARGSRLVAGRGERRVGHALVAGDWNDDGRDDLAVGAPRENWGEVIDAGAVFVILGSGQWPHGAGTAGAHPGRWRDSRRRRSRRSFRLVLASGDFDGDGVEDLAVGSPGEQVGGESEFGLVHLLPGVPGLGVSSQASAMFDRSQVAGVAASGDRFGSALAAGDFDGGGADELVIAAPGAEVAGAGSAGVIYIVSGLVPATPVVVGTFSQDGAVPGAVELGDAFGEILAPGELRRQRLRRPGRRAAPRGRRSASRRRRRQRALQPGALARRVRIVGSRSLVQHPAVGCPLFLRHDASGRTMLPSRLAEIDAVFADALDLDPVEHPAFSPFAVPTTPPCAWRSSTCSGTPASIWRR